MEQKYIENPMENQKKKGSDSIKKRNAIALHLFFSIQPIHTLETFFLIFLDGSDPFKMNDSKKIYLHCVLEIFFNCFATGLFLTFFNFFSENML